jgi:hypothetical protein
LHTLSIKEIENLASRRGVSRIDVENFLDSVGQTGTLESELLNLYYNARLHRWNISTIRAIEAGIRLAYADEAVNAGA